MLLQDSLLFQYIHISIREYYVLEVWLFLQPSSLLLQMLKRLSDFVTEQNQNVFVPRGLMITHPMERGLRVVSFHPLKPFNIHLSAISKYSTIIFIQNIILYHPFPLTWIHLVSSKFCCFLDIIFRLKSQSWALQTTDDIMLTHISCTRHNCKLYLVGR